MDGAALSGRTRGTTSPPQAEQAPLVSRSGEGRQCTVKPESQRCEFANAHSWPHPTTRPSIAPRGGKEGLTRQAWAAEVVAAAGDHSVRAGISVPLYKQGKRSISQDPRGALRGQGRVPSRPLSEPHPPQGQLGAASCGLPRSFNSQLLAASRRLQSNSSASGHLPITPRPPWRACAQPPADAPSSGGTVFGGVHCLLARPAVRLLLPYVWATTPHA